MKKALVVGGARSGKYSALLLAKHDYHVTLTDINEVDYKAELEAAGIKVVDKGHPDSLLEESYDLVVKNPGIKYTVPFIQKLIALDYKIYNEIEVALTFVKDVNVLAITGTNGKTTTVTLLYEMMKRQYDDVYLAGNIGNAVSETIYKHPDLKYLIVEMSSFQLDGTYNFKPHMANITNLQMDHLDYYASIEDYYASKQKIYANQTGDDYLFVNVDDPLVLKHLNHPQAKLIKYGLDQDSDVKIVDDNVIYDEQVLFNIKAMSLVGKHNVYNALVSALMAYMNNVSVKNISKVLTSFRGVEHRIEYVRELNHVRYYNDSKATNVESVIVALEAFDQDLILLAGGYDKKISFEQLRAYNSKVKYAILFGETKEQLQNIFDNSILVDTLEEAVSKAYDLAKPNDLVLFSPACASFDQFVDYEDRGRKFKQYVNKLS